MNRHAKIRAASEKLLAVRRSDAAGVAVERVRVDDLPDLVYFDQSARVCRCIRYVPWDAGNKPARDSTS